MAEQDRRPAEAVKFLAVSSHEAVSGFIGETVDERLRDEVVRCAADSLRYTSLVDEPDEIRDALRTELLALSRLGPTILLARSHGYMVGHSSRLLRRWPWLAQELPELQQIADGQAPPGGQIRIKSPAYRPQGLPVARCRDISGQDCDRPFRIGSPNCGIAEHVPRYVTVTAGALTPPSIRPEVTADSRDGEPRSPRTPFGTATARALPDLTIAAIERNPPVPSMAARNTFAFTTGSLLSAQPKSSQRLFVTQ